MQTENGSTHQRQGLRLKWEKINTYVPAECNLVIPCCFPTAASSLVRSLFQTAVSNSKLTVECVIYREEN